MSFCTLAKKFVLHSNKACFSNFGRRRAGRGLACRVMSSLQGQVYLVTGSTDGIGKHTATNLAQQGATVLVHGRDATRVADTVAEIKQLTGNGNLQGYTYDLASLDQIREFGKSVKETHSELDVLINNAGVFENYRRESHDGFEMTWAVNVLAPFLLTSLLVENVTKRIVNVSSISAASHIDFDNLQQEKGYSVHDSYSLSKLCSMLFTFKLAKMMESRNDVTVNCLDPGTVNTKMLLAGWGPIGIEVDQANDLLFLATDTSLAQTSGSYFIYSRDRKAPRIAYDPATQDKLWAIMETQTGSKFPF